MESLGRSFLQEDQAMGRRLLRWRRRCSYGSFWRVRRVEQGAHVVRKNPKNLQGPWTPLEIFIRLKYSKGRASQDLLCSTSWGREEIRTALDFKLTYSALEFILSLFKTGHSLYLLFISQFLTFQSVKPSFLEEPRFYWKVRPLEIIKSERVQFHCNGLWGPDPAHRPEWDQADNPRSWQRLVDNLAERLAQVVEEIEHVEKKFGNPIEMDCS